MNPYYQDNAVTIYHGDCREIVPTLGKFDLILTDPPYGMEYSSARRTKHQRLGGLIGDDKFPSWIIDIPTNVAGMFFCRWENLPDIPRPKSFIVWDKGCHGMGDLEHEFGRQWEAVAFYPGPNHSFSKRPVDVIRVARIAPSKLIHPTEKPVGVMSALISCHNCDTVLDPFFGSGSSLVAAKALGKKCVGIEIDERYCEIAARRMQQEVLPL